MSKLPENKSLPQMKLVSVEIDRKSDSGLNSYRMA